MLKIFYAVDRAKGLEEGCVIDLVKHQDINPSFLQEHVDSMFPSGVSVHGDKYFLFNGAKGAIATPAIELLFEYVRRAHFHNITSRYESFFAWQTIEEAKYFRLKFGDINDRIFEIRSANKFFRANMNLLNNELSTLGCSYLANEYWKGGEGPVGHHLWEYLLDLPVTVGNQIE